MLGKLMKYDAKSIFKVLIVFYSLAVFFGALAGIFLRIENSLIAKIFGEIFRGTAISMMFSIVINNLMRMWHRFLNDFYKDESYLTHTLPVSKGCLYLSKTLTSLLTLFVSALVIALSLFLSCYSKENIALLKTLLSPVATLYDSTVLGVIAAFLFIVFLELMNMLQSGFAGIILGHKMNQSKTGFSVLFGFGVYALTQIFALLVVFAVALFNEDLMNLFHTVTIPSIETLKLCIYLAIIIYSANIFILYFVNLKLFQKGVNVD